MATPTSSNTAKNIQYRTIYHSFFQCLLPSNLECEHSNDSDLDYDYCGCRPCTSKKPRWSGLGNLVASCIQSGTSVPLKHQTAVIRQLMRQWVI